ncbi:HAD-IIB family hydrolase [Maridesulfovibrio ferrireducens]|uniref:HAD-IIB family hydrolase n=1 Tax=Maridesulfovibrio ferrireducens TaxID=246191 RepID=UPI001A18A306|nr:HAD-IIB family hydrolase [Maridesulfovibrio ferrireducens]MBI9112028.1 HAD-IIB family hydrolase [Maridesulfovibrio ferrireducens]
MNLSCKLKELFPNISNIVNQPLTEDLVGSFFPANSTRFAHMKQAARTAERIARQTGLNKKQADKLITAALFHDIGYSEKLGQTGFHPLDGAAFLAHVGAQEEVIEAVLWHSSTQRDIYFYPEIENIYKNFPDPSENNHTLKGVSYCDFRTSPVGQSFSFGQRISEFKKRPGASKYAQETAKWTLPKARATQAAYVKAISNQQQTSLPWIFCDIDSTLIYPGQTINTATTEALCRYVEAGGKMSLITGKHLISIRDFLRESGMEGPHSGVNGSMIIKDDHLTSYGPTVENYKAIEDILIAEGIHYATYVAGGIWTRSPLTEAEIDSYKFVGEILPQPGTTPDKGGIFKVLTFSHKNDRKRCAFVRDLAAKQGLACVRTADGFLEICPQAHGKHAAAMHIMNEAGWSDLNSISIGDSENDLTMFGVTGLSAAVANATEDVLPAADLHIPSCIDNGVAQLLDALVDSAKDGSWEIPSKWLAQY